MSSQNHGSRMRRSASNSSFDRRSVVSSIGRAFVLHAAAMTALAVMAESTVGCSASRRQAAITCQDPPPAVVTEARVKQAARMVAVEHQPAPVAAAQSVEVEQVKFLDNLENRPFANPWLKRFASWSAEKQKENIDGYVRILVLLNKNHKEDFIRDYLAVFAAWRMAGQTQFADLEASPLKTSEHLPIELRFENVMTSLSFGFHANHEFYVQYMERSSVIHPARDSREATNRLLYPALSGGDGYGVHPRQNRFTDLEDNVEEMEDQMENMDQKMDDATYEMKRKIDDLEDTVERQRQTIEDIDDQNGGSQ
jgi:hypothetical protein